MAKRLNTVPEKSWAFIQLWSAQAKPTDLSTPIYVDAKAIRVVRAGNRQGPTGSSVFMEGGIVVETSTTANLIMERLDAAIFSIHNNAESSSGPPAPPHPENSNG